MGLVPTLKESCGCCTLKTGSFVTAFLLLVGHSVQTGFYAFMVDHMHPQRMCKFTYYPKSDQNSYPYSGFDYDFFGLGDGFLDYIWPLYITVRTDLHSYGDDARNSSNPYGDNARNSSNPYGDDKGNSTNSYGVSVGNGTNSYGDSAGISTNLYDDDTGNNRISYKDDAVNSTNLYGYDSHGDDTGNSTNSYGDDTGNSTNSYGNDTGNSTNSYGRDAGKRTNVSRRWPSLGWRHRPRLPYGRRVYIERVTASEDRPCQRYYRPFELDVNSLDVDLRAPMDKTILYFNIVIWSTMMAATPLLMLGVYKESARLVTIWLLVESLLLMVGTSSTVAAAALMLKAVPVSIGIVTLLNMAIHLAIDIYLLMVVVNYRRQLTTKAEDDESEEDEQVTV